MPKILALPFRPRRPSHPVDRTTAALRKRTNTMTTSSNFETLLVATRAVAADVAAKHAADVDSQARFPRESIDALREAQILSAPVPKQFGGAGCNMRELA